MKKGAKPLRGRALSLLATKGALAEISIASVAIFLVAIGVTLESVLRYGFSTSIFGLEEVTVIVGVYAYFVGSACASKDRAQIRVNIIDLVPMPWRTRWIIDVVASFMTFMICFIFAYYTFVECQWLLAANITITPIGWPLFVTLFSLLLGLVLMGMHHLWQFVRILRKV